MSSASRQNEVDEHQTRVRGSVKGMTMNRMVVTSTVSSDGVLHLVLPVGIEEANREVRVTVDPVLPRPISQEEWKGLILSTAGKWQGDFRRPEQGGYEDREPLA